MTDATADDLALDATLHAQADELLHGAGLLALLREYGTPNLHGSYRLGTMVRPEFDVYLAMDDFSPARFSELLQRLVARFPVRDVLFLDQHRFECRRGPMNCFLSNVGIAHAGRTWQIDLCGVTPAAAEGLMGHSSGMLPRLGEEQRAAIIAIKRRVWASDNYSRAFWAVLQKPGCFAGVAVYEAVLDHGVRTLDEFVAHLRNRKIAVTPHEPLDATAPAPALVAR